MENTHPLESLRDTAIWELRMVNPEDKNSMCAYVGENIRYSRDVAGETLFIRVKDGSHAFLLEINADDPTELVLGKVCNLENCEITSVDPDRIDAFAAYILELSARD